MEQERYQDACAKFAGTLELEAGLGTMLHLANCYDKVGRTASSWALFEEVASRARRVDDRVREGIASTRAAELKGRLSLLKLQIGGAGELRGLPQGASIEVGGTRIPVAMWSSAIPVDPGKQTIRVWAEGYEPWAEEIDVPPGPSVQPIQVPLLHSLPVRVATPVPAPAPIRSATAPPSSPPRLDRTPARDAVHSSSTLTLGYVSATVGAVGLAVAGYFGYRAYSAQQRSLELCRASNPSLCTQRGVDLRNEARRFAQAANVGAIAGGVAVVLGSSLIIIAPSSQARAPTPVTGSSGGAVLAWVPSTVMLQRCW